MDITSRLLLFLDVAEQGSYGKAAELRNIDRSVVSKQPSKLEKELEVRLLNRSPRTLSLTVAGVEVKRRAEVLRDSLRNTIQVAQNYHTEPKGLIKITAITSLAKNILQPVIAEFQERYPEVIIELHTNNRIVDVIGEGFDIAFRAGQLQDSSMVARHLARNRSVLVASPDFLSKYGEPQSIEDLERLPAGGFATETFRVTQIKYIDNQKHIQTIPMNCIYFGSDIDFVVQMALAGRLYCKIPSVHIQDEVLSGKLVPIMTDIKLASYSSFYAVYPHREMPMRTRLFLDAVKEHIGEGTPCWESNIPEFEKMYGNNTRSEWELP
ncbi:putative LysR family transcriptional regulator [Vibrio halioticoli NBRC 102217]|uniref:Putative LysR family transcriptional regulator n=1 Tax=Vibrio halioticoli NBRC 102217 TaxID=1219072 RepID=V5F014_9VIBR|nr:LysR family transcriptional regulator [Vibrio halioticoli]GAD88424.1 putative LysR family transcriptional regulator [Vibrio halioticoli NBRC 102217]